MPICVFAFSLSNYSVAQDSSVTIPFEMKSDEEVKRLMGPFEEFYESYYALNAFVRNKNCVDISVSNAASRFLDDNGYFINKVKLFVNKMIAYSTNNPELSKITSPVLSFITAHCEVLRGDNLKPGDEKKAEATILKFKKQYESTINLFLIRNLSPELRK